MKVKKKRHKKITMEDIAREAGCSKAAVSYVINKNHSISDELKRKINSIIEKRNYSPPARRKWGKCREIALISMDIPSLHYTAWNDEIRKRGYLPCYYYLPEDISNSLKFLDQINCAKNIAGIICLHPEIQSVDLLRHCKELPSVIFSRLNSMLSFASTSYVDFGLRSAAELLRFGHQKIACVYHQSNTERQKELLGNFCARVGEENVYHIALFKDKNTEAELSFDALDAAYASGVTVFFSLSMLPLTQAILRWAYYRKLHIPTDISVFSIDHDHFGAFMIPPISGISWNFDTLIPQTVEDLILRIEGNEPVNIVGAPFIMDNGSVARLENGQDC